MTVLLCHLTDESSSELDEESSSSDDSDRFEYSSSSDDGESSDSDSAEEIEIPEDYEPEEVESEEDRNECCHWSTQQTEHSRIRKRRGMPETGRPYQIYPDQTSSSDLAELALDGTFIDRAIRCTNNHGKKTQSFWI